MKVKYYRNYIFDFDGVIKDSVMPKKKTFESVLSKYLSSRQLSWFLKFDSDHPHLSRFEKIDFLIKANFIYGGYPAREFIIAELDKELRPATKDADFILGFLDFLESLRVKEGVALSVVSAIPQKELEKMVEDLNLQSSFSYLFGSPWKKSSALVAIKDLTREGVEPESVFFGDSLTDFVAAEDAQVDFIGVVPRDCCNIPFPANIHIIHSFSELEG